MIRHSNSFFLSLAFHSLLAVLLFFTYKNVVSVKKEEVERRVCIELCSVAQPKPIVKPIVEVKIEPKPIIEKPKPIVKKEIKKEIPVVMPKEIVKQEIVKEEKVTEEEVIFEQVSSETTTEITEETTTTQVQETQDAKSQEAKLEADYLQEHLAKIVQLLKENLYYPRRARVMKEEGAVVVRFVLSIDATVGSIEVISSKSKILSRAAIKTIEDLSGKFPKPKQKLTLHVPIEYSLR